MPPRLEPGGLSLSARWQRILSAVLAAVLLGALALLVQQSQRGFQFEASLRALLPPVQHGALVEAANRRLLARANQTLVLLVAGADKAAVKAAAAALKRDLARLPGLAPVQDEDGGAAALVTLLKQYRFHLLSASQRAALAAGTVQPLLVRAERALYGIDSWAAVATPEEDPLYLFNDYIRQLLSDDGGRRREDGLVLVSRENPRQHYAVITARLSGDAFSLAQQRQVAAAVAALSAAVAGRHPGVAVLRSGFVFHAAAAAAQAQRDVSVIALGSLAGIVLLFWAAFRSLTPLLLSLTAIAFGCLCAVGVSHAVFGGLHVLTLVFGASLIGVAVDYALHFFTRLYAMGAGGGGRAALAAVFPGMALALVTTVIAYACLASTSLPGLRQVALFSVVGLVGAWLFVAGALPWLARAGAPLRPGALSLLARFPTRLWARLGERARWGVALAMPALSAALSFAALSWTSDIRALYQAPPELAAQEAVVRDVVRRDAANQYFLVTASSAQGVLEKSEALTGELRAVVQRGALGGFTALSDYLPSAERQAANYRALKAGLYGADGPVWRYMAAVGFEGPAMDQHRAVFAAAQDAYLAVDAAMAALPRELRRLWLGDIDGRYATVIVLRGVNELEPLRRLAESASGVYFVDNVADISAALDAQRAAATRLLGAAYGVVGLLLLACYRRLRALALLLPVLVASFLTLAVLVASGVELGLFHVFALFLILGLGMDYSIFLHSSAEGNPACALAVLLSALTSALSFGLLSLSSTPMVQAFGITVLLGSLFNVLLAPLARLGRV